MQVSFTLQSPSSVITSTATIQVIIQRPLIASSPPKFSHSSYQFVLSESLEPGSLARNAAVTVYESDELSVYSAGFSIELLSTDLGTPDGVFELVPKYGMGTLVASVRLSRLSSLNFEQGKGQFNYIVSRFGDFAGFSLLELLNLFSLKIKATSRSSGSLTRFANLTLLVGDYNEFAPVFERDLYTVVVNNPENYQTGDVLAKVTAYDSDATRADIFYSIVGMFQEK